MKKSGSRNEKRILILWILHRIKEGNNPKEIASRFGWSQGRLQYWLKQLKTQGLIFRKVRSSISVYALTPAGENFYTGCVKGLNMGGTRLHNVGYRYVLEGTVPLRPEREWWANGVPFKMIRMEGTGVVWTPRSVLINVEGLWGSDAFEIMDQAKAKADRVAQHLREAYGMVLGAGALYKKPEFAVVNPLADAIARNQTLTGEIGKMDASYDTGEFEFFTPEDVMDYMKMPKRMGRIEDLLVRAVEQDLKRDVLMQRFTEQLERHLEAINGIAAGFQRFNVLIETWEKKFHEQQGGQ